MWQLIVSLIDDWYVESCLLLVQAAAIVLPSKKLSQSQID